MALVRRRPPDHVAAVDDKSICNPDHDSVHDGMRGVVPGRGVVVAGRCAFVPKNQAISAYKAIYG